MNIREKIAALVKEIRYKPIYSTKQSWQFADQILTLLKEHIEGLGVISDEEINRIARESRGSGVNLQWVTAQAQLQYIKDELLKEMKC